jgi:hypothetical protein
MILTAFPWQRWLRERVLILSFAYLACVVLDVRTACLNAVQTDFVRYTVKVQSNLCVQYKMKVRRNPCTLRIWKQGNVSMSRLPLLLQLFLYVYHTIFVPFSMYYSALRVLLLRPFLSQCSHARQF